MAQQVQAVVRLLFDKFDELGTVCPAPLILRRRIPRRALTCSVVSPVFKGGALFRVITHQLLDTTPWGFTSPATEDQVDLVLLEIRLREYYYT